MAHWPLTPSSSSCCDRVSRHPGDRAMSMTWIPTLHKNLFRGRQPRANRPRPPVFRPKLEALEERTVPSIVWTNRGQASDGFDSVFGARAGVARAVVDAAITSWDRVITNFNQVLVPNLIDVEISMDADGASTASG